MTRSTPTRTCDGCGGEPCFNAAVPGGMVELCENCREVVVSILGDGDDE